MTLKARRILYISFIIVFFLAAPPLVLYTAGFRYDFEYNRVVETGSMVVKSTPSNALVFINGEAYPDPTPTIINTILPGKINLLVQKEGYYSWEKIIEIKGRVTSFEENVVLFAQSEPEALSQELITRYWWNRSQDKFAYATANKTLRLYNTLNQKDTLIANLDADGRADVSWSPHADEFLFSRTSGSGLAEHVIVSAQSPERIISLANLAAARRNSVQWDPRTSASLYALKASGELIRFNYLMGTERMVFSGPVVSYLAEGSRVIMIAESGSSAPHLLWFNPADQSTLHLLPFAHVLRNHAIVPSNSQYIVLRNNAARELTIIDPAIGQGNTDSGVVVIKSVSAFTMSENGGTLAYSDGFSVYARLLTTPLSVLPAAHETGTLLARYSKPVTALALNQNGTHVFYFVDGDIRVNEIAAASDPRSITLLSLPAEPTGGASRISSLAYASRRNALEFIDAHGILHTLALSREDGRTFPFGN